VVSFVKVDMVPSLLGDVREERLVLSFFRGVEDFLPPF
jgi:hypothetical protein